MSNTLSLVIGFVQYEGMGEPVFASFDNDMAQDVADAMNKLHGANEFFDVYYIELDKMPPELA